MRTAPAFVVSTALAAATLGAVVLPTGHVMARIPHPGGSAVVLHVAATNDWSFGSVTVRGDGEVVIQPGLAPGRASPEPLLLRVGEDGVQRGLQAATTAGLLGHLDVGSARLPDGRVVTIEIHAHHHRFGVTVPAGLDPTRGPAPTGPQRRARDAVRRFVRRVLDPSFYRPVRDA